MFSKSFLPVDTVWLTRRQSAAVHLSDIPLSGIFFILALVVCVLIAACGPPWYLIHKFAKGKVKTALYILLGLFLICPRDIGSIDISLLANFGKDVLYLIINLLLLVLIVGGIVLFIYLLFEKPFWGIALLASAIVGTEIVDNWGKAQSRIAAGIMVLITTPKKKKHL